MFNRILGLLHFFFICVDDSVRVAIGVSVCFAADFRISIFDGGGKAIRLSVFFFAQIGFDVAVGFAVRMAVHFDVSVRDCVVVVVYYWLLRLPFLFVSLDVEVCEEDDEDRRVQNEA